MPLSYAGISLSVPPQEYHDWVEKHFRLPDLIPFRHEPPKTLGTISWPTPWDYRHRNPIARSNTLWWPTGASRWAMGFFWAAEERLAEIREAVYGADEDEYNVAELVMDDGVHDPLETEMWLLPPIPVTPQKVTYDDGGNATAGLVSWLPPVDVPSPGQPFYLLPLVDVRYFWWQKAAHIQVDENTTTWAQLYSALGTALGVTITNESVDSAYLKPAAGLSSRYEFLPLLLDAVAASVGQRVVRKLDGTVVTQGPVTALAAAETNLGEDYDRLAGGLLALDNA